MEDLQVDIITAEEADKITKDALIELAEHKRKDLILEIKRIEYEIKCAAKKGKNQLSDAKISIDAAEFLMTKGYYVRHESWTVPLFTISWASHDKTDSGEEK